jgi:hypothetical protein
MPIFGVHCMKQRRNCERQMFAGQWDNTVLQQRTASGRDTFFKRLTLALLIALSFWDSRYRELMPVVRISKGRRNVTEQNLLCISDVVRTGKVY